MAGPQRSPNYPSAPVTAAIDSARRFYGKAQRTTVHPEEAQRAMGYNKISGASRSRLAALKQYGLLDEAKGGVRLSDLGLQLLHPQNDDEYQQAVAAAALTPPLFKELWDSHRTADPSIIASHLIRTRNFSTAGAKYAADAFKATAAVVKASPQGYSSPDGIVAGSEGVRELTLSELLPPLPGRSGRAVIWRESGNVGPGLLVDLRLEGEAGRKITQSEFDRLEQRLKLALAGLKDEVEDDEP